MLLMHATCLPWSHPLVACNTYTHTPHLRWMQCRRRRHRCRRCPRWGLMLSHARHPRRLQTRSRHALVAPSLRRGAHSPHVPCLSLKHVLLAAHRPHAYATSDRAESYWLNDLNTRSRGGTIERAQRSAPMHTHTHTLPIVSDLDQRQANPPIRRWCDVDVRTHSRAQ